jgi:hypothetical protein
VAHRRTTLAGDQDPRLTAVARETLEQAIQILSVESSTAEAISHIGNLLADEMAVRRLIIWIPEAFGMVLISHLGKIALPTTFSAQDFRGQWREFELKQEPIFTESFLIAHQMYRNPPQEAFMRLCERSALANAVVSAMDEGCSLDGGTLQGPALVDIPAEVYFTMSK